MSKSGKKKKKSLKRKAGQDDVGLLLEASNKYAKGPHLKQHKHKFTKFKKPKMSSQTGSSSHSTTSGVELLSYKELNEETITKSQCDLCKLSYSSKDKLTEHLVSLMHHTKLDNVEENQKHDCVLCSRTFVDMSSYRDHIGTKKHLKNLQMLRGVGEDPKNREENGPNMNNLRNQKPPYTSKYFNNNNNYGWQDSHFQRGQNYGNFQESRNWNQHNFNHFRPNSHEYGGKQNDWNKLKWMAPPYNPRNESMNFENYQPPWGSGVNGHGNWQSRDNAPYTNQGNNWRGDFTADNFDCAWDEQSFRQHEDFLANMDQGYPRDVVEFHQQGRHPQQHFNYQSGNRYNNNNNNRQDADIYKQGRWDGSSFNDRKRPRHEDYPVDPTAKSSKSLEQENDDDNDRVTSGLQDFETETLNAPTPKSSPQINVKTSSAKGYEVYQEKSSLDNASDTILERAERLCKELREKREASSAQRTSLLKSQTHHSVNDKMNNLKKNQQSYLKGHIKNVPSDQVSSGDSASTISAVSTALSHSTKEPSSQNKPPISSSSKIKTLDEIRKSIEKSVLEESQSAAAVPQEKNRLRVRASSLSESSTSQTHSSMQSRGKADLVADHEGRPMKVSGGSAKAGPKQPISKEKLNKMVNCPRSRTERLHLARMFQSRADSRSSAHVSSRSNINLEGLYDSHDISDIEINVGDNMPTIKLEDLSNEVRSQILGLIQDDIGMTQSSKQQDDEVQILEADGHRTKKSSSTGDGLNIGEKDSAQKTLKKKNLSSKTQKKSKVTSADIANIPPLSVNLDVIPNPDLISTTTKSSLIQQNLLGFMSNKTSKEYNKNKNDERIDSLPPSFTGDVGTSPRLTSDNVLSRYPTLLGTGGSNASNMEKDKSPSVDDGRDKSSVDSGILSMSLSSSSMPLPVTSSSKSPSYEALLHSESQNLARPISSEATMRSPIEEAVNLLRSRPPFLTDQPKELSDVRSSIASSLNGSESSNTMSELLQLSEQEESVKQEMMSMELRLTRLHRLLEQAVFQINKCTERRNELQDEEKTLTRRRMSLLREATSSSQQDGHPSTKTSSVAATTPSLSLSTSITTTESNVNTADQPSHALPSTVDMPNTQQDFQRPETSLSRSEWLAKFSAYLPSGFIPSNHESSKRSSSPSHTSAADRSTQPVSSSASDAIPTKRSSDASSMLQMVPEKESEPVVQRESYVSFNRQNNSNSESFVPGGGSRNAIGRTSNTISESLNTEVMPSGATQEFSSPIMYVGTIKSGAGPGKKSDKPAPVMTLNSATLSSLFGGCADLGENLNPVKIVGMGEQSNTTKETSIPPVIRRPSIESPRQEDSDIGSIASVASGSSLGEQISRYCRFTPGASANGQNPHDLSVILSGPSDTSDLRGLEDEDNFGEDHGRPDNHEDYDLGDSRQNEKLAKLKEDSGNNRLYGRLDQESVKSAEALHLLERNNEVPSSTNEKNKKKKRKTKQQRDSGIHGRPKPYVISSSSADENETNKAMNDKGVSIIENVLRKGPESTTDNDSSDHPNASQIQPMSKQQRENRTFSNLSPSKLDQGTEITVAECDSSTGLGMVDSHSLNESSNRIKEMNASFEKSFGRKLTNKVAFFKKFENTKNDAVVLSDDNEDYRESHQNATNSKVVDLCNDNDDGAQQSFNEAGRNTISGCGYSVCFLRYYNQKIYVGYLGYEFKVLKQLSNEDFKFITQFSIPKLSCMEVTTVDDTDQVFVGSGHSIIMVMKMKNRKTYEGSDKVDLGTTVKCLHIMNNNLFAGLDTGEMCVRSIKPWKETHRYICSDCPIHCMSSGTEGGIKVLCVASQDSTITVVDADRCLPLRILTGHTKTAFSVHVYGQYVFSGSGDSTVITHNLHTARVEHVYNDNKGVVCAVFYSNGFLFTGGMDKLVRVYDTRTQKLIQVYYGAAMGAIRVIYVHQDSLLITGNSLGSVDVINLNLKARNVCGHRKCGLNFGLASHLTWHVDNAH